MHRSTTALLILTTGVAGALGLWACSPRPTVASPPVLLPGMQAMAIQAQAGEIVVAEGQGKRAADLARQTPFRLDTGTAICSYRGEALASARTAALAQGCNALTVAAGEVPPAGVRAHVVVPGFDWPAWMTAQGLKPGGFGALVQTDTALAAQKAAGGAAPPDGGLLTIAPGWPFLDPAGLATQPWFAGAHSTEEQAASEGSYYGGAVHALGGEIAAAQARGWGGVALSWRQAPSASNGLPEPWAWERIAAPLADKAVIAVPLLPGGIADAALPQAVATLEQAIARAGDERRIRAVLPLAGLGPEDAQALPFFAGAEGIELVADAGAIPSPAVLTAVSDGLALVKAVERVLGSGRAVAAGGLAAALAARRPLVCGRSHEGVQAMMTYDPFWAAAGGERSVVVAALPGTTLRLPAGRQVRVFLFRADTSQSAMAAAPVAMATADDPQALAALARLSRVVPRFTVLDLPASGTVDVPAGATLTIEDLRGVALDDDPPIFGLPPVYKPGIGDGLQPAERAYQARGIAPFRFRHFHNEFHMGGRGVAELQDYASTHGFDIIGFRPRIDHPHLPPGTGSFATLSRAIPKDLVKEGRYDLLVDRGEREDLATVYATDPYSKDGYRARHPGNDLLMLDIEHPVLKPDALRRQTWYPHDADPATRSAFETKYYRGYGLMYTAAIAAARRAGYPQVSIYGWYPVPRIWWGLEKQDPNPDPANDWAWNAYGKDIYSMVDIVHPSVYCFYVSSQNVAYSLANIDLTRRFLESIPGLQAKPMRVYYWLRYHGGGAGGAELVGGTTGGRRGGAGHAGHGILRRHRRHR